MKLINLNKKEMLTNLTIMKGPYLRTSYNKSQYTFVSEITFFYSLNILYVHLYF